MLKRLSVPTVLIIALLLGACQPITAPPTTEPEATPDASRAARNAIEFEMIDVECADRHVVLSDSPFVAGHSVVEISQEPDAKDFTVMATHYPDAYPESTWEVPGWGVDLPDGGFIVYHAGDGTGAFEGSRILHIVRPLENPGELPCEPVGPLVDIRGVIITDLVDGEVTATEYTDVDVSCPDGNVVISTEPLTAGRSEVTGAQEPGELFFTIDLTWYPDAHPDGSWVAPGWGADTLDGGFLVIHSGEGAGSLEGDETFFMVAPTELDDLPCEPVGPVVKSEGVFIQR